MKESFGMIQGVQRRMVLVVIFVSKFRNKLIFCFVVAMSDLVQYVEAICHLL